MSTSPSTLPSVRATHRSGIRQRLICLLAAVALAGGLFSAEKTAAAQGIGAPTGIGAGFAILGAGVIVGTGVVVSTITLDFVQGVQLTRRGYTSRGVAIANLVLSIIEFGAEASLLIGDLAINASSNNTINPSVGFGLGVMAGHGLSSIIWSAYGLTRLHPSPAPAVVAPDAELPPPPSAPLSRLQLIPTPMLLRTPTSMAPGLGLVATF